MTHKYDSSKILDKAEYGDNNATFQSPGMAYFKMSHFVPKWVLEDAQIKYYGGEKTVRNWVFNFLTQNYFFGLKSRQF